LFAAQDDAERYDAPLGTWRKRFLDEWLDGTG